MCGLYGAKPQDIFSPDEVDYGLSESRRTGKPDTHKLRRKLTVRLTEEQAAWLQPEILHELGYGTKTDWLYACIRRSAAQYAIVQKHKKNRLAYVKDKAARRKLT
jgi:hypothetical protein